MPQTEGRLVGYSDLLKQENEHLRCRGPWRWSGSATPSGDPADTGSFIQLWFYKRQRVPVNPACEVFLAEIRGNNDRLYDLDAAEYFGYLFIRTPATRSSGVALSGPRNESRAVDATK